MAPGGIERERDLFPPSPRSARKFFPTQVFERPLVSPPSCPVEESQRRVALLRRRRRAALVVEHHGEMRDGWHMRLGSCALIPEPAKFKHPSTWMKEKKKVCVRCVFVVCCVWSGRTGESEKKMYMHVFVCGVGSEGLPEACSSWRSHPTKRSAGKCLIAQSNTNMRSVTCILFSTAQNNRERRPSYRDHKRGQVNTGWPHLLPALSKNSQQSETRVV